MVVLSQPSLMLQTSLVMEDVDVVICDDPVSADCGEWGSPTKLNGALGRFVQYQWFNELNSLVTGGSGIDDDGISSSYW